MSIEVKILKAIETNKLNPSILGERKWCNYFIRVNELVWSINNHDGYQIEIYSDNEKTEHLGTVRI